MIERELPKYQCHKIVHALKIDRVESLAQDGAKLYPADAGYLPFNVGADFVMRNIKAPVNRIVFADGKIKDFFDTTGYYVVYSDGYLSWSPTEAFEQGYSRI